MTLVWRIGGFKPQNRGQTGFQVYMEITQTFLFGGWGYMMMCCWVLKGCASCGTSIFVGLFLELAGPFKEILRCEKWRKR